MKKEIIKQEKKKEKTQNKRIEEEKNKEKIIESVIPSSEIPSKPTKTLKKSKKPSKKQKNSPFGSRYRFERIKGKGTYGTVEEYYDTKKNEKIAIKRSTTLNHQKKLRFILREIKILSKLQHEKILKLKYIICHPNPKTGFNISLVTNVWPVDLRKIIKYSKNDLTDDHIKFLTYQILWGLHYLHSQNILHRDLKPSNILTNEDCEIVICDFGFARQIKADFRLTEYVVTRFYRAPEVVLSTKKYNKAVDMWSFGCILYELIEGKPLFPAKNYTKLIELFVRNLGTPGDEVQKNIDPIKLKFIKTLPYSEPKRVSEFLGMVYKNKEALDLLDKCLLFDPEKRCTAEEALRHEYFKEYFDQKHLDFQDVDIDFGFDFPEKEGVFDVEELKRLVIREINEINGECGEECYFFEDGVLTAVTAEEFLKVNRDLPENFKLNPMKKVKDK